MIGVLIALGSIAVTLLADDLESTVTRFKAKANHVSIDDVLKLVNQTLARANSYQGNKTRLLNNQLAQLSARLNALPFSQGTGIVKQKIQEARRNINSDIVKKQDELTRQANEDEKLQQEKYDLQTRANSFANATDSYKTSAAGKRDYAAIQTDAQRYADKVQRINQGVENYV